MTASDSAQAFTETLLQVIRQQRHLAARVIIATQEPTISTKLLDLCTMTIVHRFTSPEWMAALKSHLAGVSEYSDTTKRSAKEVFDIILKLEVGEALLFSPTAMMDVKDGKLERLGTEFAKMRTRRRVTKDGGKSVMGVEVDITGQNLLARVTSPTPESKTSAKPQKGQQLNDRQQKESSQDIEKSKPNDAQANVSGGPGTINNGKTKGKEVQVSDSAS